MYDTIFSPIDYGGLTLKNRIIHAPTTFGLPDEELLAKLGDIARGGCAMLIIGDVPVGKSRFEKSLFDSKGFDFYRRLTTAAHEADCRVCAQLHRTDTDMSAIFRSIPGLLTHRLTHDELRSRLNDAVGPYITRLPARKLAAITASFGPAAKKAREAGFDMVQVHGDRMCGSLASSLLNGRTDAYGGSLENRLRFAAEAVRSVRETVPDMAVDFKLVLRQENPSYGCGGILEEDLPAALPLLEAAGVTSWHVTLADHSALENTIPPAKHPAFGGEGCFLKFCDAVRKYSSLPVCGVGGLTDPDFVEAQLASGRIDCAAMSRQLIADPAWPRKLLAGEKPRKCVRCNRKCLGGLMCHEGVHCVFDGKA